MDTINDEAAVRMIEQPDSQRVKLTVLVKKKSGDGCFCVDY